MGFASATDLAARDVVRIRHLFVNCYLVGTTRSWILVDAALPGAAGVILDAAAARFGPTAVPEAIVLTHGHFDHVGALSSLLSRWDVPVFAHERELPHLTGLADYPPPDPTVGEGAMALMSGLYPSAAIDLGARVRPLPDDGSVPGLAGWRWLPTPGHSDGHVSLFRDDDRCLLAGDAFVTVKQESLYAVALQQQQVNGPPAYFTPDWIAARDSVRQLAELRPEVAATGHGTPMSGQALRSGLDRLAADFERVAVPARGRYVPDEMRPQ
jgi:glyoxylase-like metal-dependent hydrolase (beta-lactamase superfamily II)